MKQSAGILLFRTTPDGLETLLAHSGGPYWRRRDAGAWSIPKGEVRKDEDVETAARREFFEEIGFVPTGALLPLGTVRQNPSKRVTAFACEGEFDPARLKSNTSSCEWPPGSGHIVLFPEIDRVEWFSLAQAQLKIIHGQRALLDRLNDLLE